MGVLYYIFSNSGGKIENGEPWTWLLSKLYRAINEFEVLVIIYDNLNALNRLPGVFS